MPVMSSEIAGFLGKRGSFQAQPKLSLALKNGRPETGEQS